MTDKSTIVILIVLLLLISIAIFNKHPSEMNMVTSAETEICTNTTNTISITGGGAAITQTQESSSSLKTDDNALASKKLDYDFEIQKIYANGWRFIYYCVGFGILVLSFSKAYSIVNHRAGTKVKSKIKVK